MNINTKGSKILQPLPVKVYDQVKVVVKGVTD